jgi:hypothetical protein
MKKRRGRDEGSIYKRKDGRWVAVYTVEGKKRYIYAKTRKEAARRLRVRFKTLSEGWRRKPSAYGFR